jgi:2-hydroxychromene-2-carboxylate isomerase
MKQQPRFYFSFRSPYSWIAARMLAERSPAQKLEYIPYWSPDTYSQQLLHARGGKTLYVDMSKEKHLYILQDIRRLTRKLGYQMAWPIDRNPWWDLPHLAYLRACRLGKGPEFFWAVHRSRWERAEDICSNAVLRQLADETGIDADELASAPDDADIRAQGVDALYRAYNDGVFGVPFFIHRFEKFWGVDRIEDFITSLAQGGLK